MDRIWAVARITIAQALRMKIAGIVVVLLVILLPVMSVIMTGDGTLIGKLQTFSSYGLSLVGLLLSILTIAISCFTLSDEIKRRQLFLVVTKPVLRWQIVLGKFLGVILIDIILLLFFSGIVFGLTIFMPKILDSSPNEIVKAQDEFFTAREGIKAFLDEKKIMKQAQERFEALKKENRLPERTGLETIDAQSLSPQEIFFELLRQEKTREESINPGQVKKWDFYGVKPADPNVMIFVRYKFEAASPPQDGKIYGLWSIGDLKGYEAGTGDLKTPIYNVRADAPLKTVQTFSVPAITVNKEHYLGLGFFNNAALNETTVMIQEMEILYKVGTFSGNFSRGVMLILIRLIFLAAMGIALTTWLSFPVAVLACIVLFSAGLVNGFIVDAIDNLGAGIGIIYTFTIKPLLYTLPRFDGEYNPTGYIVSGKMIPWLFLLKVAFETAGIKVLLLMILGVFIFHKREVAKHL